MNNDQRNARLRQLEAFGNDMRQPIEHRRAAMREWTALQAEQEADRGRTMAPQQYHPPVNIPSSGGVPFDDPGVPLAPSRYLVLPDRPDVAPGATSQPVQLEFSAGGGWLIGWSAIALDPTVGALGAGIVEQTLMAVRMFMNDGEELISNGLAADFAPFATIFAGTDRREDICRYVYSVDTLTCLFQNLSPAGGPTLRPFVTFRFWRNRPKTG